MPEQVQSITLPNRGLVMTTYIVVNHCPADGEWDIKSVEICADPDGKICLADFSMDELPRDTQEQIYAALEAYQHARHGMRRLWRDLHIEPLRDCEVRMPQL